MRTLACLIVFLSATTCSRAANRYQEYVGQSGCAVEFKSSISDYGIRLDQSQRARLEAHVFESKTILTIVQYSSDSDKCGIVRDVIEAQGPDRAFVWDCVDKQHPRTVVVGRWPVEHTGLSSPALEAWRIDLKQLKFVRLHVPVMCTARSYAGSDRGGDLATWARKRAAKHETKSSSSQ